MDLPEFINLLIPVMGWERLCTVLFDATERPARASCQDTCTTRLNTGRLEMTCKSCRGLFQGNKSFHHYILSKWTKYFPRLSAQVLLGNFEDFLDGNVLKKYCRENIPTERLHFRKTPPLDLVDAVAWVDTGGEPWSSKHIHRRAVQEENHKIFHRVRKGNLQVYSNKNLRAKWNGKEVVIEFGFGKNYEPVSAMQASGYLDADMNPTHKFLDECDVKKWGLKSDNWLLVENTRGLKLLQMEGLPTCTGFVYFSERTLFWRLIAAVGGSSKEIYFRTVEEMKLGDGMEYLLSLAYLLSTRGARALIWRDFRKWRKGEATHSHIGNRHVDFIRNTSETFVMREGTF
jgi:hypothetical protein